MSNALSPAEIQGVATSGEVSRVLETDLPKIPLKGGNGCTSCGISHMRGGAAKRKSYRKKSNRKSRSVRKSRSLRKSRKL